MANPFKKISLPLGVGRRNKFKMNPITTTTQEWFSIRPVFSVEMVPGSDIDVAHSYYTRLSPLVKPMLGTGRIVNRAFFVPYRTIMPGFDDMMEDNVNHLTGNRYSNVPYCKASVLARVFSEYTAFKSDGTSSDYDFSYNVSGTEYYRKFSPLGRQIYAILTGLGYSISWSVQGTAADIDVSLMKILAYCRIVADWYVSNNFYERANNILGQIYIIGKSTSPSSSLIQQLANLFQMVYYSTIDDDYFSTASVQPVTPPGSSSVRINDVTNDAPGYHQAVVASDGAPSTQDPGTVPGWTSTPAIREKNDQGLPVSTGGIITQYALNALSALTSYMQRNNIVGYKTLDRFFARYGVHLNADKLDRSYYLGMNQSSLRIDEVMSNADTTGAALGAYVGRGEGGDSNNHFHYSNDGNSFGLFIILSTIIPDIHYGQGISRDNLHINKLDFWTPEFDALGMQAIARAELYYDAKSVNGRESLTSFAPNETFGFQPTYSEYCRIPDILSGDFRRRQSLDLRGFHLYRMFNEDLVEGSPSIVDYKTISENFVIGNPSEYNKIFNSTSNGYDHFYCVHSFGVKLVSPKKRLIDSFEFHDDNEGRQVTMDYKGTKLQ